MGSPPAAKGHRFTGWYNSNLYNLMNTFISDPAQLELMPEVAQAPGAVVAEQDSASILEAIQARESTLTPVMEEILRFRPSSHWGINE